MLTELAEKEVWIDQMERSLAESRIESRYHADRARQLERALHEATSSISYKFASQVALVCRRVAPPGTGRRTTLRLGYRSIKAVSRLRNRQWVVQEAKRLLSRSLRGLGILKLALQIEEKRFVGFERARVRAIPDLPHFTLFDQVDASIIVPVSNRWRDCLACMQTIARFTNGPTFEVIAVHDGSSGDVAELLKRIPGVVALRNEGNPGFIGACNRGAASAKGAYLVFLNNDAAVTAGWLDALAGTFRDIPGTGIAGAKVVDSDGRLREAGSIIWKDGTRWSYGNSDDAGHPRYNFTRPVDCCSGVGVMVSRALFERFGGFESKYTHANYENTDLALRIRQAGHKVIYQPHATIVQKMPPEPGFSLDAADTSFEIADQMRFTRRWSDQLAVCPTPPPPDLDRNRYASDVGAAARGRVLVIDHKLPFFDQDAGSLRMMEMIRALSVTTHRVTFVPADLIGHAGYLENLQAIGVEVIHRPYYDSIEEYLRQHGREFDLAIISRPSIAASHLTTVRRFAPRAKIVFDTVDLHFVREKRQASVTGDDSLESAAATRKHQELQLASRADLTLVVSPVEKEILETECPGIDVRILATIHQVDEAGIPGFDGRHNIVFIGGFQHLPNPDAVLYFAREVFPLVRERLPDAVFQVIGPDAPPEVIAFDSASIQILGHVADVGPLFDRARVSVAPLRFGAGVKGKVNQSMSLGVPVVVTSVAAEGMHLVHEDNAMIADDPERFADAVVRLWTSRELWERVSWNGRQNIKTHFSREAAARSIADLLEWAGLASCRVGANRAEESTVK
jgi:O-antigen biosynthesis protein